MELNSEWVNASELDLGPSCMPAKHAAQDQAEMLIWLPNTKYLWLNLLSIAKEVPAEMAVPNCIK